MLFLQKVLTRLPSTWKGNRQRRHDNSAAKRDWGKNNDIQFLLRGLEHTVLRFCLVESQSRKPHAKLTPEESVVLAFLEHSPRATIQDIASGTVSVRQVAPDEVKRALIQLVDKGIVRPCGRAPLEEVDDRYERVPACAVCGSPSQLHKTIFWKYNTPVMRCDGCGLYYANPRWKSEHLFGRYTPEFWTRYADTVKDTAVDVEANYARWLPFLSAMDASRKSNRILDVGCATGEFLLAAKARGWKVYGVETSPIAAEQARRLTGGTIHAGTLDTADFPDGYFDVVTLWDVIEHLQDPRAYLERVGRLLRSSGILSVTTPNIRSVAFRLLGPSWIPVGPNDHLYYFAPRTLARLLSECGFSIYTMHTMATESATWHQWLRFPLLQRLAPMLRSASLPVTNRLLLGDELYLIAQHR
jgi:2-polyprenyl-3-methyl-5-hydroxy-6-metoxy-1,4-benzoquinol methylase